MKLLLFILAILTGAFAGTFFLAAAFSVQEEDRKQKPAKTLLLMADALFLSSIGTFFFGFLKNLHKDKQAQAYLAASLILSLLTLLLVYIGRIT